MFCTLEHTLIRKRLTLSSHFTIFVTLCETELESRDAEILFSKENRKKKQMCRKKVLSF